jgi:DNA repair protein RadC
MRPYTTIKRYTLHVFRDQVAPYQRKLVNSRDVAALVTSVLGPIEHERLIVLFLDAKSHVTGYTECARGGMLQTTALPLDVFRTAVHAGAVSVILAHNHPSGDPAPSDADRSFTQRLRESAALLGIQVLDHVVTTADPLKYYSMADRGGFL